MNSAKFNGTITFLDLNSTLIRTHISLFGSLSQCWHTVSMQAAEAQDDFSSCVLSLSQVSCVLSKNSLICGSTENFPFLDTFCHSSCHLGTQRILNFVVQYFSYSSQISFDNICLHEKHVKDFEGTTLTQIKTLESGDLETCPQVNFGFLLLNPL